MHLYSFNLSALAMLPSIIMSELLPAVSLEKLILFYCKVHKDFLVKKLFKSQKP